MQLAINFSKKLNIQITDTAVVKTSLTVATQRCKNAFCKRRITFYADIFNTHL